MKILWDERAWEEYLEWQAQDKKTLKRINMLIKDIQRECYWHIVKQNLVKSKNLSRNSSNCNKNRGYTFEYILFLFGKRKSA